MQVGTLVKMKGDPHCVFGVISEVIDDSLIGCKIYYKVLWLDEMCDPSYADEQDLEVVCK
jgi:hypothetical protein